MTMSRIARCTVLLAAIVWPWSGQGRLTGKDGSLTPVASMPGVVELNATLTTDGVPIRGAVDLQLWLYDSASGGNPVGHPIEQAGVPVENGALSLRLDVSGPLARQGATLYGMVTLRLAGTTDPALAMGPFPIPFWHYENEHDWIIALSSSDVYARRGSNGMIVFTGSTLSAPGDVGAVANAAIGTLDPFEGGSLYFKTGRYSVGTSIDIIDRQKVSLIGEAGAVLTATTGTAILIDGTCSAVDGTCGCAKLTGVSETAASVGEILVEGLTFEDCAGFGINVKRGFDVTIRDCVFRRIQDSAINGHIHAELDCPLRRLRILDNHVTEADCEETGPGGGIYCYFVEDGQITGNTVEKCGSTGVVIAKSNRQVVISGNVIKDNDCNQAVGNGHGLYVASGSGGGSAHVVVSGNVVQGNGGNGIEVLSGDTVGSRMTIVGNSISGNGHVNTSGSAAGWASGLYVTGRFVSVTGNQVTDNFGSGIKLGYADRTSEIVVQGNAVADNGVGGSTSAAWASGIALSGLPTTGCKLIPCEPRDQRILITGNHVSDDTGLQVAAIHCVDDVDGVTISGNMVSGLVTPLIRVDAAASTTIVQRNTGFVTESNGSAVIVDGDVTGADDFVDVAHGLDMEPAPSDIQLTPNGPLDGRSLWISDVTASSFRINLSDGDTATGADVPVSWQVVRR